MARSEIPYLEGNSKANTIFVAQNKAVIMYTSEEEKELVELAKRYIKESATQVDIVELRRVIGYADWRYYVMDNPIVADAEYDSIFKQLVEIEKQFPNLITQDSPTQRVALGLNKSFNNVAHLVPMLSLENSYNAEDLLDWDRRCKELSGQHQIEYCVEPKFDGASISLLYENDMLIRAATRGNGVEGDEITMNAKQIRSIPLKALFSKFNVSQVEIRGEVVITKKRFEEYNNGLVEAGQQPLANARNAASGSLRIKDPKEVGKRNLDAFLYNVSFLQLKNSNEGSSLLRSHKGVLDALNELGFKTAMDHTTVFDNIESVIQYVHEFELKRDNLPYEIDGMVIKVNRLDLHDKIGQTSHHPRWAMAFKFKARQATSKLLNIEYQVGRTGSITPVAKIEPVSVGGVSISSISLFNEDVIRQKNLMLGDTILVERAGDVIPYIVKSFPELRSGTELAIEFPTQCPVCGEATHKPEGEAVSRCVNMNCEAQVVERIIHFTSKDAMDIRGLGEALVRRFYELGFLKSIVDIYSLPFEKIKTLEGLGEKSMQNLKEAIEKSKEQALHRIIFGLGIRYVGETTAKALSRTVQHLSELQHKTKEELLQIEDVGEKVASSIVEFFAQAETHRMLQQLEQLGLNLHNSQKQEATSSALAGKSFLFTGTLSMKRSEAEALAEAQGGSILGSVSSKLNYLVVGEDAGSKLEKAKKLGTVNILSEEEFLKLLGKAE